MGFGQGDQLLNFDYQQYLKSDIFNRLTRDTMKLGVYQGYGVNILSNTSISVNAGIMIIGDGADHAIRCETRSSILITVSSSTPYIVAQWAWQASTSNPVSFIASSAPVANDIVIGKCIFSGATLTGIDYSERTFANISEEAIFLSNSNVPGILYINPGTNFWYISGTTVSYIDEKYKTNSIAVSTADDYYIQYTGTGYSVTNMATPVYDGLRNGWYNGTGGTNKLLAYFNYNGSVITINGIFSTPDFDKLGGKTLPELYESYLSAAVSEVVTYDSSGTNITSISYYSDSGNVNIMGTATYNYDNVFSSLTYGYLLSIVTAIYYPSGNTPAYRTFTENFTYDSVTGNITGSIVTFI